MFRRIACVCIYSFFTVCTVFSQSPSITSQQAKVASEVLGLEFSQAEIDSLLAGLNRNLQSIEKVRALKIGNDVAPSLIFNPLPLGFSPEKGDDKFQTDDYTKTQLPSDKNLLAFYSIGQLAHLIKSKQITSLELTKFFISRLKEHDKTLHCVITLTEELALEQAKRADKEIQSGNYRGILHGIPYGVKDLLAVQEYKTTWGATPYKKQQIDETAEIVQRLEAQGAVLVAKLTLGALAWGDVWFGGKTRNPWNPEQGSSGSSAGSASAVAAGLIPFAIGSETLGSIVSPSTVCGTTGLRPTFGAVSRHGAMALSWTMDKLGPLCRTVEDCAIVFRAIHGKDAKDPFTLEASFDYSNSVAPKSMKIGYVKELFDGNYAFKKQDSLTLKALTDAGVELIPIELPDVLPVSYILTVESAAAFEELTLSNQDDELVRQIVNAWPNAFRTARFVSAVDYIQANRYRSQLIHEMDQLMKDVDLYLSPSWHGSNLLLTNLTGHPCVVLPNGFSDKGTPTSITFNGRLFEEGKLMRFAKFYQDLTKWNKQHPAQYQ